MADQTYGAIDPETLMAMLSDPQMAEQLAQMGAYDDISRNLDKRAGLAEALASTPGAQGREVGRTYVASSPLEHIAGALQRGIGMHQLQGINAQRDAAVQGNVGAAKGLAAAMAQAMRARRAQSVGAPPTPGETGWAAPVGTGEAGTDGWGY